MSAVKIMAIGFLFVIGWLLGYLFIRQIIFNMKIANPVLDRMHEINPDLIVYDNAKKYTTVSVVTCVFVLVLFSVLVVILDFIDLPLKIAFFAGLVTCTIMLAYQVKQTSRTLYESFCRAYYRFVPDDQLRTDMYNCRFPAMKLRCHDMGVSTAWIPKFDKE